MSNNNEFVVLAGGLSKSVDELMIFGREIWRFTVEKNHGKRGNLYFQYIRQDFDQWQHEFLAYDNRAHSQIRAVLFSKLVALGSSAKSSWLNIGDTHVELKVDVFNPTKLVEACLNGNAAGKKSDRDYFIWKNIRTTYKYQQSPEVVHVFHILTATMMQWKGSRHKLMNRLVKTLTQEGFGIALAESHSRAFLECCVVAEYVSIGHGASGLRFQTTEFDPEYLLSKLFGLRTDIAGLDNLFGGGGLALADSLAADGATPQAGRIILIRGRFGTGKSSLALALASEVARKEGIAWVMPLEQSAAECRLYLESMNSTSNIRDISTLQNVGGLANVLHPNKNLHEDTQNCHARAGAIILLQTKQDTIDVVFERLVDRADDTRDYTLRLLILDPINSLLDCNPQRLSELRIALVNKMERIRQSGANLLIVAEDDNTPENPVHFLGNIVDTVIDLSVRTRHGYSQRYIEVLKSRLQRDQRGEHPFSIKSGHGLTIFPSSAAVLARIRHRHFKAIDRPTKFGWNQLDEILGSNAIFPSDVIVLRGAAGMFKTHIGLLFLLGSDISSYQSTPEPGGNRKSLILPIRDNKATIHTLLKSPFISQHRKRHPDSKGVNLIEVLEIPGGYVQPGAVFQALDKAFETARVKGDAIDRVLIDNVSHWETSCPFISEDETFGDTLIEYLRRQQVTTLVICGDSVDPTVSSIQTSLVDDANTVINFSRIQYRGSQSVRFQILKTRAMRHKTEHFDVSLTDNGLELGSGSKLLRISANGDIVTVPTRLYLHEENSAHAAYNLNIEDSLKPVLSRNVDVNSKDRTRLVRAMQLGSYSTVDELQVIQLDEFQLPDLQASAAKGMLYTFAPSEWDASRWGDISARLVQRVKNRDGSFFAVPFYDNLGLLSFHKKYIDQKVLNSESWDVLAGACSEWDSSQAARDNPQDVFFYFPTNTDENYNCFFFEILLSLGSIPEQPTAAQYKTSNDCKFEHWLADSRVLQACIILRRLCHRIHTKARHQQRTTEKLNGNSDTSILTNETYFKAQVSRHWFSTLSNMLRMAPSDERRWIEVQPLPGQIAVAGEWYLGVPTYSVAPDVGLEIIKTLTTRAEELERFRRGIGLPTREAYFSSNVMLASSNINLPAQLIGDLLRKAFRRSQFDCYGSVSRILSHHLRRIIETEPPDTKSSKEADDSVANSIKAQVDELRKNVAFILHERPNSPCQKCAKKH